MLKRICNSRRDDDAGSQREVHRIFSGTFSQELERGVFPLSAAGTAQQDGPSTVSPSNQFYLEQAQ
jgi:hypothetical protein